MPKHATIDIVAALAFLTEVAEYVHIERNDDGFKVHLGDQMADEPFDGEGETLAEAIGEALRHVSDLGRERSMRAEAILSSGRSRA